MSAAFSLISEVEITLAGTSPQRRGVMVGKVADLFVSKSDELTDEQLSLFDDVILRFAAEIEQTARALLARRLAPYRNAPPRVIRALAFDSAIEVAEPVLAQSARLDDKTLIEIARTKGQGHMLAISQRGSLSEAVTDILVELGNREVVLSAVDNYGANFSDRGFSMLVDRCEGDDTMAEFVGSRPEIPAHLLTALIAKASQTVRTKLEAAHPWAKTEVQRAVAEAAGRVEAQVQATSLDYTTALAAAESLQRSGRLDEHVLASFAKRRAYAETVAAFAVMCDMPLPFVVQAMGRDRSEALIVLSKAIGLSRSTVEEILLMRAEKGFIDRAEIIQRLARFQRLQAATAQRIVRVHRIRARANSSLPH
jgi:uncharacterized protein (DUF2336 family)